MGGWGGLRGKRADVGRERATRQCERIIRLTPQEIANIDRWSGQRNDGAREGRARSLGTDGYSANTLGLLGEMAVERYLGLPLRTRHITYAEEQQQHFDVAPPGAVQVKAVSKPRYGLAFSPAKGHCPWCPYILAFIPDPGTGTVILRGWAIGEQIQAEGRFIEKPGMWPIYALLPDRLFALPEQPHPYFYLEQTLCRKMRDSSLPPVMLLEYGVIGTTHESRLHGLARAVYMH